MNEPTFRTRFRPRLSLRAKLLLAAALLLALPYAGYRSVNEMERYLRAGLDDALLGAARAIAGALHERPGLLSAGGESTSADGSSDIYVHALDEPVQLDGYTSDWGQLNGQLQPVGSEPGFGFAYVAGQYDGYLYLLLSVEDDRIVYSPPDAPGEGASDHLALRLRYPSGRTGHYVVDTTAPGWARATEVQIQGRTLVALRRVYPIRSEWRETDKGYVVEMRLPLELAGSRLALEAFDVDTERGVARARLGTAPPGHYGRLLLPSAEIGAVIASLGATEGRRIWVVDERGRVRASGGSLSRPAPEPLANPIFRWVLAEPAYEVSGSERGVSRLSGPALTSALSGTEATHWRAIDGGAATVVSAAHPIRAQGKVIGAVLVEETAAPIQTVRQQALADLFGITLLSAIVAALVLLGLASRLVMRIQRLRDQADAAIDAHGRVIGGISESSARDEIGDLSRSVAEMLERLRRYNSYLEQLSERLSHELRTPIAVVRSSLENLSRAEESRREIYYTRAMHGVARLNAILGRMSEATRIEQAIESAEPETFDLAELLEATVDAYRQTWAERTFDCLIPERPVRIDGVPDLVAQLLDKLVGNALDFGDPATAITFRLERDQARWRLQVENRGSSIPPGVAERLFDSLVTERPAGRSDPEGSPHLGLGLHIARLIAELHRGEIQARNVADPGGPPGVVVSTWFPARRGS